MADDKTDKDEDVTTEAGDATEADETAADVTDAGAVEDPDEPPAAGPDEDPEASAEEKPKPKAKSKPAAKKPAAKKDAKADDTAAEKPKRTRKKKADADDAKDDDAADEASADEVAEKAKPDEVDKPKRRRRGAAEVSSSESRRPARRGDGEEKVVVRAKARYVRTAPRKARLVVDNIRGKSVDEARAILIHTPRAASRDVLKLLDSAIANAENNHELVADELKIDRVFVDEGPTLKRFRPRALGRATQIRKRTSHMTILLTPKE